MNKTTQNVRDICWATLIGIILILAGYGANCYITRDDINKKEQLYINYINNLKSEREVLRSCVRWELILVDTLSVQEKTELDAIEESLRQRIQRTFITELKKTE